MHLLKVEQNERTERGYLGNLFPLLKVFKEEEKVRDSEKTVYDSGCDTYKEWRDVQPRNQRNT